MHNITKWGLAALTLSSANALAAPVDLSTWQHDGSGNWSVQNAPANDSVKQTSNGDPTVFFEAGTLAQGQALSGTIKVETSSDDDFIGFVLGYEDGEIGSSTTDFILIDWKQNSQSFCGGTAGAGLSISRVTDADTACSFWTHTNGVTELKRATSLGSSGWADNTEYAFDLQFTGGKIEVSVNNVLELELTAAEAGVASFDDGAFGFYNYSQSNVRYSAIEESTTTIPTPAPGGLMLMGLGVLGLLARRRH